jgi:uncharacterized repeat protein (TIGR01451 family)
LGALINPKGESTSYHFDLGTTTQYGNSTATQTTSAPEAFDGSATITGLMPGTTYHYRVVATNALVSTTGQDASFTTPPAPAAAGAFAVTEPASDLTTNSATLNGVVNPQGLAVSYHFEWGTTNQYGQSTPTNTASGANPQAVGTPITGLAPGTPYHYRLVVSTPNSTNDGADQVLTTPAATPAAADIGVTIAAAPNRPVEGGLIAYRLRVTNDGPATATGVTLTDLFAHKLQLLYATSSQGTCSGRPVAICRIGTLAAGAHADVTVRGIARTDVAIRNTAFASALQPDPNSANNFATVLTEVRRSEPAWAAGARHPRKHRAHRPSRR